VSLADYPHGEYYTLVRTPDTISGYVVCNLDGTTVRDAQTSHATYRICRLAGLPEPGWHALRHGFGSLRTLQRQVRQWRGHTDRSARCSWFWTANESTGSRRRTTARPSTS